MGYVQEKGSSGVASRVSVDDRSKYPGTPLRAYTTPLPLTSAAKICNSAVKRLAVRTVIVGRTRLQSYNEFEVTQMRREYQCIIEPSTGRYFRGGQGQVPFDWSIEVVNPPPCINVVPAAVRIVERGVAVQCAAIPVMERPAATAMQFPRQLLL